MSFRPVRAGLVAIIAASLFACEHTSSGTAASDARDSVATGTAAPQRSVHDSAVVDSAVADSAVAERAPSPRIPMDTADPGAVVGAYLRAMRDRAFARDTMLWEPPTGTDDGFRTFRDTAITSFHVGAPGRIEGAAGSRYVDVPLTVDLAAPTAPIRLRGTATLRRAVVDGASVAQRHWRIVRIQWIAPTASSPDSTSSHR